MKMMPNQSLQRTAQSYALGSLVGYASSAAAEFQR